MNGESFAETHQAAYGQTPDADAVHGYVAARLFDLAVRAAQEDVSRRGALAAALEEVAHKGL